MNYRIIILLALMFVVVYNLKIKKDVKKLTFNKEDSLNLKGLFCLLVIIGHLATWTNREVLFSFSSNFGFFAVAGFLFISGYGLAKNKNDNILKLIKKLLIIGIPFILINIVFYFLLNSIGTEIKFIEAIKSLVNFYPIAYFSWYVVEILIFYVMFYITKKVLKKPWLITLGILLEIIVYNMLTYRYGLIYSWWLSNFAFVLGILIAFDFKTINKFIKKYYKIIFSMTFILFLLTLDYQFILGKEFNTNFNIFIAQLCITLFPFLIYLFLQKFEFNSKILRFIGKYSYEIYLVQGIPLLLLRSKYIYVNDDFLYTFMCILISIIVGIIFYYINNLIFKITKLKTNHNN